MDYLSQTGLDALKGADILGTVTEKYSSDVEYATNSFAKAMKGAAQVLQADIGTRICYTQHGSFDAHTNGIALQEGLLTDVAGGIYDFYTDMKQANKSEDVIMFVFSEFGRRVKDNGNGTDHGSGGVAFVIGDAVAGGQYSEYPSLRSEDLLEGDLHFNLDYLTALSSSQSRLTSIPKPGASDGLTYPFFMTGVPGRETISSSGTPGGDTPSDRSPHGITGIA